MPVTGITIGIAADTDTFTPMLWGISDRLIAVTPLYAAWYDAFRKIEQRRFNAEGPGWTPLADATVEGREALGIGGAHPILNRSGVTYEGRRGGQLRQSLTTKDGKNSVVEPIPDGLFIGTSDPVAIYHQMGTHGAGRDRNIDMPARPVVDLDEADAQVFADIASDYFFGFETSGSLSDSDLFSADALGI